MYIYMQTCVQEEVQLCSYMQTCVQKELQLSIYLHADLGSGGSAAV